MQNKLFKTGIKNSNLLLLRYFIKILYINPNSLIKATRIQIFIIFVSLISIDKKREMVVP